jgi:hypothetical protein
MTEIWKDVVGYEGLYQVSNLGRVKSYYQKNGVIGDRPRLLSGKIDKDGYVEVRLCNGGKVTYVRVHRLVGSHFLSGDGSLQINHKDGNKANNRSDNLEYVTAKENSVHAHATGLHKGCVTKVKVVSDRDERMFGSITEAAKYFGVNRGWFRDKSKTKGNTFSYNGVTIHLIGGKCGD